MMTTSYPQKCINTNFTTISSHPSNEEKEHLLETLKSTVNPNIINTELDKLNGYKTLGKDVFKILVGFKLGREYIKKNSNKFMGVNYNDAIIGSMERRSNEYESLGLGADIYFPSRKEVVHTLGIIGDEINLGGIKKDKEFLIRWIKAMPIPNKIAYGDYITLILANIKNYLKRELKNIHQKKNANVDEVKMIDVILGKYPKDFVCGLIYHYMKDYYSDDEIKELLASLIEFDFNKNENRYRLNMILEQCKRLSIDGDKTAFSSSTRFS